MKLGLFIISLAFSAQSFGIAKSKMFDVTKLPQGKNVTVGQIAVMKVPVLQRVELTPTDTPQSIKFTSRSRSKKGIKIAIYDKENTKVRYIQLKNGDDFLYSFSEQRSIVVIPENTDAKSKRGAYLQVTSNRPVTIAR